MRLKDVLKGKLNKKELQLVPSSFDLVGDIAIFNEIPPGLRKKEKLLAETLLKLHKNIMVVCKKAGKYSGKLRTPKLKVLAGEKRKETLHKEAGVLLKLNPETCYFSTRSSTERLRIAGLVKKGESVLTMFSGVSPFPLVISKNSQAKEVYGIELNPIAHKYALENIRINKVGNVTALKGDVRKVMPKLKKKFDRIIMPHPTEADSYLDLALDYLKPHGTIHMYAFVDEKDFKKIVKEYEKDFKSVKLVKGQAFGPRIYRVCLDLKK